MPIRFKCPTCGAEHSVADDKAGVTGTCRCGAAVRVPTADRGRNVIKRLLGRLNHVRAEPAGPASAPARTTVRDRPQGHTSALNSVSFSPDGLQVLTGGDDHCARLWDVATGSELQCCQHDRSVYSGAFSPSGQQVLTASNDKTARLWGIVNGRELCRLEGHDDGVLAVAFGPDGGRVLTGSRDTTARLWDVPGGRELRRFEHNGVAVQTVAFSANGCHVLTAAGHTARVWDVASGRELRRVEFDEGEGPLAFGADGTRVLTGAFEVTLWDMESGGELRCFETCGHRVSKVALSAGGQLALARAGEAWLWDVTSGRELRRFGHGDTVVRKDVTAVAFSPDGKQVLTGGRDWTARVWDVASGHELRCFGRGMPEPAKPERPEAAEDTQEIAEIRLSQSVRMPVIAGHGLYLKCRKCDPTGVSDTFHSLARADADRACVFCSECGHEVTLTWV